jgi:hypothetical protein
LAAAVPPAVVCAAPGITKVTKTISIMIMARRIARARLHLKIKVGFIYSSVIQKAFSDLNHQQPGKVFAD